MVATFLTGHLMVRIRNTFELKIKKYIFFILGNTSIKLIKYPKTILGGKSNPKLKNLKPFIKVSYTTNTERL